VTWRVSVSNFRLTHGCSHGRISGSVHIYKANIAYKGGNYRATFRYRVSGSSTWRSYPVTMRLSSVGSTDSYYLTYDGHIDLPGTTGRITHVKVSTSLSFNRVPGAPRRVECVTATRVCSGHIGG
jgi:hypothetical protein